MNPVPKIEYPEWLHKRIKTNENKFKQKDMRSFFEVVDRPAYKEIEDLQTMGVLNSTKATQLQKDKDEAEAARISKEKYSKVQDCPDPADPENFTEWIKFQK